MREPHVQVGIASRQIEAPRFAAVGGAHDAADLDPNPESSRIIGIDHQRPRPRRGRWYDGQAPFAGFRHREERIRFRPNWHLRRHCEIAPPVGCWRRGRRLRRADLPKPGVPRRPAGDHVSAPSSETATRLASVPAKQAIALIEPVSRTQRLAPFTLPSRRAGSSTESLNPIGCPRQTLHRASSTLVSGNSPVCAKSPKGKSRLSRMWDAVHRKHSRRKGS